MVKHRPIKGKPKTVTVIRLPCGRWYATIAVEQAPHIKPETETVNRPAGVDRGLTDYLYLFDGTSVDNPHFLDQHEKCIGKAQRNLSNKLRLPTGRKG